MTRRGKLGVTIRAKDGTNYVINTCPRKPRRTLWGRWESEQRAEKTPPGPPARKAPIICAEDKEIKFSEMICTFVSGSLLLLLLAGCGTSLQRASAATGSKPASDGDAAGQSQSTGETQEYEDAYLSYEISADWQKHENSSGQLRLTLFTPQEAATATPSNVSVQILSL